MDKQRKRQFSVRTFHPAKTTNAFNPSPHKFLPTVSENRELKKNTAKQLTQAISKFTNYNNKQSLKHSEQLLRSTISVVKSFSTIENNFQHLFEELHQVLKRFCFALDDSQIGQILQAYRIKEGCSYRKTVILMSEELSKIINAKDEKIKIMEQNMENMKRIMYEKQIKWGEDRKFMESQVERYKQLANIEYMVSLEEQTQRQKTQINEMTTRINLLLKENDEYLKQIEIKENSLHQLNYENALLKTDTFDLSRKLDSNENYFNLLKDRFDGLLVKMMGLKEIISKVEEENSNLVSERAQLVSRAAVSFNDLTPRPKYKELLGFQIGGHINSTADIFANVLQKAQLEPKQIVQKIILKKKNYKLQEAEAIREKVVEDIIDSKQKMKKMERKKT